MSKALTETTQQKLAAKVAALLRHCCSTDEKRTSLNGVRYEETEYGWVMAATNGHVITVVRLIKDNGGENYRDRLMLALEAQNSDVPQVIYPPKFATSVNYKDATNNYPSWRNVIPARFENPPTEIPQLDATLLAGLRKKVDDVNAVAGVRIGISRNYIGWNSKLTMVLVSKDSPVDGVEILAFAMPVRFNADVETIEMPRF